MTVLDAVIGPNWGGTFRDSVVGRLADRIQAEAVPVEGVGSDSVSDRQADEQRVVRHWRPSFDSAERPTTWTDVRHQTHRKGRAGGRSTGDVGRRDAVRMLVIDAANVIGSRPTGWWRDRPGATRRFTERVRATVTAGRLDPPVTLVLEGRARAGADEADVDGVEVVHAPGEGDDTIAAIAEAHREVIVVTADRELAERVRAANAEVVGPSWLFDQLVD